MQDKELPGCPEAAMPSILIMSRRVSRAFWARISQLIFFSKVPGAPEVFCIGKWSLYRGYYCVNKKGFYA